MNVRRIENAFTATRRLEAIARSADRVSISLRRLADNGGGLTNSELFELVGVIELIRDYATGSLRTAEVVPEPQSLRVPPPTLRIVR